ncbi:MAG: hypothetical protein AAF950_16535 [Pseudomonadota bacterium]
MMRTSTLVAAAIILAGAADAREFTATQSIEKVVTVSQPNGAVALDYQSASRVAPGDTLFYHIDYSNDSADPAEDVELVMVVPAEVSYLENTANSGGIDARLVFSADNGETFSPRRRLKTIKNGVSQTASAGDITHIKWTFKEAIAPGADGKVSFRATVR